MSLKFENTEVWGIEHALRGMRNPMNSWNRADTIADDANNISIGENDLDLAQRLLKAGPEHRKYLRQIFVSVDITAPRYWWQEFDTYKIGTVANSCSTMHKLHIKPFELSDFSINESNEHNADLENIISIICDKLNIYRSMYLESKDFSLIKKMKKILPESYNQKRTVTLNFEVLLNMVNQRRNHRLSEWKVDFINWTNTIKYFKDIININ